MSPTSVQLCEGVSSHIIELILTFTRTVSVAAREHMIVNDTYESHLG